MRSTAWLLVTLLLVTGRPAPLASPGVPPGASHAAVVAGVTPYVSFGGSIARLRPGASGRYVIDEAASVEAVVTALAATQERLWTGDAGGVLHAFSVASDGLLHDEGRIDLSQGVADRAITRIVPHSDGKLVVVVSGSGLVFAEDRYGVLRERGRYAKWDQSPSIGVYGDLVYILGAGTTTRLLAIDTAVPESPTAIELPLSLPSGSGPGWYMLVEVDAAKHRLYVAGGLVAWAGRPCTPCYVETYDLAEPRAPAFLGRTIVSFTKAMHLLVAEDRAYLLEEASLLRWSMHWSPFRATVHAYGLSDEGLTTIGGWSSHAAYGRPARLPFGELLVPLLEGGCLVLDAAESGASLVPVGGCSDIGRLALPALGLPDRAR